MRIAICDDDRISTGEIKKLIAQPADLFDSGEALLASPTVYDIIFLDIEMSGIDGISAAAELRNKGIHSIIIFVSSHEELILDSFSGEPFGFLVKPIDRGKFFAVFERAKKKLLRQKKTVVVMNRDEKHALSVGEILYFDVFRKHVTFHCLSGDYTEYGVFSERYEELKDFGFLEYNKGCAVNILQIRTVAGSEIVLKNGARLYMSAAKKNAVVSAVVRLAAE